MKRIVLAAVAAASLMAALPAGAAEGVITYKSLAPDVAFDLARAALNQCRKDGYQVAVVVLDRFGAPLVELRDRYRRLGALRHRQRQGLDRGDLHPRHQRLRQRRQGRHASAPAWPACRR